MRVVVTGATGMIGSALVLALRERGDEIVALSRDAARGRAKLGEGVEVHAWPEPAQGPPPAEALAGAAAIVNLLGEPVAQRWSDGAKRRIRESRVAGTRALVRALSALPEGDRPRTLVSQSASGYYGPRDAQPLDEEAPAGDDFLAGVVVAWEEEARAAESIARVVRTRTGVVLSPGGGALAKMLPPFKLGVGGPVAGGRQYVPWVHLDDVVGAILRCLDDDSIDGAVNVSAPNPVTNKELSRALGRVLRRPAVAPVPALALRVLYGEMSIIVTTGQRVVPARLERAGHRFRFPDLEPALRDVLRRG
jgi:uncharacterized protein (TIGR01777 family)